MICISWRKENLLNCRTSSGYDWLVFKIFYEKNVKVISNHELRLKGETQSERTEDRRHVNILRPGMKVSYFIRCCFNILDSRQWIASTPSYRRPQQNKGTVPSYLKLNSNFSHVTWRQYPTPLLYTEIGVVYRGRFSLRASTHYAIFPINRTTKQSINLAFLN